MSKLVTTTTTNHLAFETSPGPKYTLKIADLNFPTRNFDLEFIFCGPRAINGAKTA